jgi:hypothetical protein
VKEKTGSDYDLIFGDGIEQGAQTAGGGSVSRGLKNMASGRSLTAQGRRVDADSARTMARNEARSLAVSKRGPDAVPDDNDYAEGIQNIASRLRTQKVRPSQMLADFERTGQSISTGAVSGASSQGRAAAAAAAAAGDDAAKAAKGTGAGLMEWAKANPMPAAVVGGAGMLALPRLINGTGQPSTIVT